MICKSCQSPAFNKPCAFCGNRILSKLEEYEVSEVKGFTMNGKRIGSKKIYFHTKCYLENTRGNSK